MISITLCSRLELQLTNEESHLLPITVPISISVSVSVSISFPVSIPLSMTLAAMVITSMIATTPMLVSGMGTRSVRTN